MICTTLWKLTRYIGFFWIKRVFCCRTLRLGIRNTHPYFRSNFFVGRIVFWDTIHLFDK